MPLIEPRRTRSLNRRPTAQKRAATPPGEHRVGAPALLVAHQAGEERPAAAAEEEAEEPRPEAADERHQGPHGHPEKRPVGTAIIDAIRIQS